MCLYIVKLENNEQIILDKSVLYNPINWLRDDIYLGIDIDKIKRIFVVNQYCRQFFKTKGFSAVFLKQKDFRQFLKLEDFL
ncbi:hypothetical protein Catovirus_1_274 [Catovirus CTV1]|uniref:Uncharacterized protein n=1 Tax=Catovirus CTV1 TaxID=1977631 RepID=A0A1V0S956_9VIRU|nr:hypothetical protein Catovirus_1_274 [Catovirus CTV1]